MPNQIILLIVWLRFTNYRVGIKEDFIVKKRRRLQRNVPALKLKKYLLIFPVVAVVYFLILIRKFPKCAGNFRVE
jgi:hypothetical protein